MQVASQKLSHLILPMNTLVKYKQKKQSGFTLLEVLLVFFIMGLILAIIPPFFPNVIDNIKVKSAARELATNLKYARSLAIKQQKETIFIVDIENKAYLLNEKTKTLLLPDASSISLMTTKTEQLSETKGQIRFFPDSSSTGGQIKLTYLNNEYVINIDWLTGKIKIEY